MKPRITWIIIADHAKARLFQNFGIGNGIEEIDGPASIASPLPARELASDRPGRVFDSKGRGRHAMGYRTPPDRIEKQKFARSVARWLNERGRLSQFDRLAIVAPAKMLGDLRKEISGDIQSKVFQVLDKDLVNDPAIKIAQHLKSHDMAL